MRPRCSVFVAMSLDGFIARLDGRIDWLSLVERRGEDYGYKAFLEKIDTLVVGRKTYETALGFDAWPYTGKRCVVMTREKRTSSKHGEEFSSETPMKLVARLAGGGAKRIYVDGGAVVKSFLAAGLVTDLTVSIVPVLLGEGTTLFGNTGPDIRLELVGSRAFGTGLVQVEYRIRKTARPAKAREAKLKSQAKGRRDEVAGDSRPKDVIGFLFALPMDPTSTEVNRLAHEFGITGPVEVKTYTSPTDDIHFDMIEGDEGPWVVTRYPRDMKGWTSRMADQVLENLGGAVLGAPRAGSSGAATGLDAGADDDGFIERTSPARSSPRGTSRANRPR